MLLVKFYSETCQPCKMLSPILKRVLQDFNGVILDEVDVSASKEYADKMQIRSVPTLVLIDKDKEVARKTGMLSEAMLRNFLSINV